MEMTLENTGEKTTQISTAGEANEFFWYSLERTQLRNSVHFLVYMSINANGR